MDIIILVILGLIDKDFFKQFFFQGGMTVPHTSLLNVKNKNYVHKSEIILDFL